MSIHKEIKLFNNDNNLFSVNVTPHGITVSVVRDEKAININQSPDDMRRLARFILDEVKEEDAK
jgi:hypothetical protein